MALPRHPYRYVDIKSAVKNAWVSC